MFGKLFGRGKVKRDQLGFEITTTGGAGAETTVTTTTTDIPFGSGMDAGAILAAVQAAQAQTGGDREALTEILRKQFGDAAVTVEQHSATDWSVMPEQDPITLLATLTELHEKGVVTDEQFEAQKRRLLG